MKLHQPFSLSTRLLLVFIAVSFLIACLIVGSLLHGFSSQWRSNIKPHLFQYLSYVNADIGNPPDIEKAEKLSKRLGINIYINGGDLNYSSTGQPLNLDEIEFHDDHRRWHRHQDYGPTKLNHKGQKISVGEHNERTILRNTIGQYQVFYELPRKNDHRAEVIKKTLFWLLVIFTLSYFLLRHMLKPIQDIKVGVKKIGQGDLSHRLPIRSNNDLGELSGSINQMAEDIEHMLDAKRQLLLALSHELRSPLTRAKIATQMLDESGNRDRIEGDLLEMEALITEILESERINSPHAPLHKSQVDLKKLILSVLKEISADQIKLTAPDNLPPLNLDENRIRLLVRNLVSNAIHYSETASERPEVVLSRDKNTVVIRVIDYGPGIPPEEIKKVTEPFYRVDPSRTRTTGGFGIGLYLCQLIAEAHGGDLTIDSEVAKGTRVTVSIPTTAP